MDITFLLGNGFDIQLGMESRYADFLETYILPSADDNENIRLFKQYLSDHRNRELWSDAEIAMGKHIGLFSEPELSNYVERIADFEDKMFDYLAAQQDRFSFADQEAIAKVFNDFVLRSPYDILCRNGADVNYSFYNNTYHFVTFNYTNLIDDLVMCCAGSTLTRSRTTGGSVYTDIFRVHHVHGSLSSQIIMGVNDASQLYPRAGIRITEDSKCQLIKPKMNLDSGNSWDRPAMDAIRRSNYVFAYGVSYGETDNIWWDEITEWLKEKDSRKFIAFIRDSATFNPRFPWAEVNYNRTKRREILEKLSIYVSDPAYDQLLSQIHVIPNTRRLELKPLILKEKVHETAG